MSRTIDSAEALGQRMDRLQAVQRTVRLLTEELQQLAPRPVRDEMGDDLGPALDTDFQSGFAIELTHGGWNNPLVLPRSTLQRSAYRIEDDELVRYHWMVLDRTLSNLPNEIVLLDGVEELRFRFLQANGDWTELSVPLGARQRPRAAEILLSLADEGEIRRIVEIAP